MLADNCRGRIDLAAAGGFSRAWRCSISLCGHGRIANALAARGCRVTGLDVTPLFLDRARHDDAARGVAVTYVDGDMRDLPWPERFDRVINWFSWFGYLDDVENRRVLPRWPVYSGLVAGSRRRWVIVIG